MRSRPWRRKSRRLHVGPEPSDTRGRRRCRYIPLHPLFPGCPVSGSSSRSTNRPSSKARATSGEGVPLLSVSTDASGRPRQRRGTSPQRSWPPSISCGGRQGAAMSQRAHASQAVPSTPFSCGPSAASSRSLPISGGPRSARPSHRLAKSAVQRTVRPASLTARPVIIRRTCRTHPRRFA